MTVMPGPDFPTAGFIHGIEGIREAYKTGRGIIQVRARAAIETQKKGDKQQIVVTEIPYMTNKARLLEKIAELVHDKRIEGISDLRDESDREGMRIVIELKRDAIAEVVLNNLYRNTQMQTTFGIIFLAIVNNKPEVMDLPTMLRHFIEHRKEIVVRRTRFELRKAEERAHILEGLVKALDILDEVIALIRGSRTPPEAKSGLDRALAVQRRPGAGDPRHAPAAPDRPRAREDRRRVQRGPGHHPPPARDPRLRAARPRASSPPSCARSKKQYGDARRTEIVAEASDITIEDMIADEDMVITVSRGGYIKRSPLSLYRAQRRGGKGRIGMQTKEEDIVEHLFVASTHAYVLVFTDRGRMYWIKVHAIPEVALERARQGDRQPADRRAERERPRAAHDRATSPKRKYVVMVTRAGKIKKTELTRVLERPRHRHHRHRHQRGRRSLRRAPLRRQRRDLHRHARRHGHPLQRERTSARWAAAPPASRASRSAKATRRRDGRAARIRRAGSRAAG